MEHKTAKQIIKELKDRKYTYTMLAKLSKSSVSTISRVANGEYADIDYNNGKLLEQLLKSRKKP